MPPPKDVHNVVSQTYDYVNLQDKMNFVDMTQLRVLRWEDFPGLSRWAQYSQSQGSF